MWEVCLWRYVGGYGVCGEMWLCGEVVGVWVHVRVGMSVGTGFVEAVGVEKLWCVWRRQVAGGSMVVCI